MTTMPTPATGSPAIAVRRPRRRLAERLGLRRRPRTGRRAGPLHPLLLRSADAPDRHAGAPIAALDSAPAPVAAAVPAGRNGRLETVRGATAGAATAARRVPRTEAARMTHIDVELLRTRPRIF
jgi:hypothetical protein